MVRTTCLDFEKDVGNIPVEKGDKKVDVEEGAAYIAEPVADVEKGIAYIAEPGAVAEKEVAVDNVEKKFAGEPVSVDQVDIVDIEVNVVEDNLIDQTSMKHQECFHFFELIPFFQRDDQLQLSPD